VRLWYASDSTTFEEYLYHDSEGEWRWQQSWKNLSAAAGVGCYSWGPNNIYAAFVNLQNQVEIHHRTKADAHLSDGWEKCKHSDHPFHSAFPTPDTRKHIYTQVTDTATAEAIIPDVHLASSISLDSDSSVVQTTGDGNPVRVFKMRWGGRNTQVVSSQSFDLRNRTLGTRVAALPFRNESEVVELVVFSQNQGDDITQSSRPLQGAWDDLDQERSSNVLPS